MFWGFRSWPREIFSYLRVFTDKQGKSGLDIEAQRQAVERYLNGAVGPLPLSTSRLRAVGGQTVPSSRPPLHNAKAIKAKLVFANHWFLAR